MSPSRPSDPAEVFPVALLLRGRRCVVVGSGAEAERRVQALTAAGADVHAVPESAFRPEALDGAWLCVIGDDVADAARVSGAAETRRVFCCAVDRLEHSSFVHMAIARAGRLSVAVTSSGAAPALARRLREELSRLFDAADLAGFVTRIAELRQRTEPRRRREVLGRAVAGVRFDGRLELPAPPDDHSNEGAPGGPGIGSGGG